MAPLDRLERVTDLLLVLLDTSQPLSLREIANRVPGYPDAHSARRQAFERDKRLLRDEGVPVLVEPLDGQDQLGYRVDPDAYYLPDLGLDAEEQAALALAVAGVHLGEPTGRAALSKLGSAVDSPRLGTLATTVVDLPSPGELPALPVLFDALRQSATVTFEYRGASRHVDPAGIRFRRGHWYLIGADRDRQEARTFRVDRVEGLPTVGAGASGALPEGFDVARAASFDPWQFGEGEETEVDVVVDGAEAGRVLGELGEAALLERGDDGAVVVRVAVTDLEAFISWVLGLLDHAEVLAPVEVRQATVARLRSLAGVGNRVSQPPGTADRLRRLLAILAWLSQAGEAPIDEVADRFGLAPSALVSELELAACCGLPPYTPDQLMEIVVSDTTVSARLGSAMGRPRRLSPQEGFALAASARALLSVPGSDPRGALSGALAKLERALGGERLEVELDTPMLLPTVQQALADGATLAVTYYSASTDRQSDREITPVRIFASEGHWYVDARCHLAGDVRRFRIDRISRAEVVEGAGVGEVPTPDPSTDPMAGGRRAYDAFVPGPDTRTVRLSVARAQAAMLESIPAVDDPVPVGDRLEVDVVVGGDAWLERLLLRLGAGVRVIDPPGDATLAAEAATRILKRYGVT